MFARISILLCLLSCASCSIAREPQVVVKPQVIRQKVPAALLRPCPRKQRGPIETTGDVIDRLTWTESALATCAAQVDGIRKWNAR